MRKLLIVLFLLLITGFSVIGFSTDEQSVNDEVLEVEQDQ